MAFALGGIAVWVLPQFRKTPPAPAPPPSSIAIPPSQRLQEIRPTSSSPMRSPGGRGVVRDAVWIRILPVSMSLEPDIAPVMNVVCPKSRPMRGCNSCNSAYAKLLLFSSGR
jgi:hypothetical protein